MNFHNIEYRNDILNIDKSKPCVTPFRDQIKKRNCVQFHIYRIGKRGTPQNAC